GLVKSQFWDGKVKSSRYGAALSLPRNEAYLAYAAVTRDAAERRYWTFYEAVKEKYAKERAPLLGCAARGWARGAVQLFRQTEKPGNKLKN
ncbi:MAG: hypothetical protein SWH68_06035, partial [Thermodesulfobacteriota bacterium]|nr:hypothetical protein [Thermodesulfobacteriota bacterium]